MRWDRAILVATWACCVVAVVVAVWPHVSQSYPGYEMETITFPAAILLSFLTAVAVWIKHSAEVKWVVLTKQFVSSKVLLSAALLVLIGIVGFGYVAWHALLHPVTVLAKSKQYSELSHYDCVQSGGIGRRRRSKSFRAYSAQDCAKIDFRFHHQVASYFAMSCGTGLASIAIIQGALRRKRMSPNKPLDRSGPQ